MLLCAGVLRQRLLTLPVDKTGTSRAVGRGEQCPVVTSVSQTRTRN